MSNDAVKDFDRWLYGVGNKRRFCYHKGFLGRDRFDRFIVGTEVVYRVNKPMEALANEVWDAYMAGLVHLTQERLGPDLFGYWATKAKGVL